MPTELESRLQTFLEWEERQRRQGVTLEAVKKQLDVVTQVSAGTRTAVLAFAKERLVDRDSHRRLTNRVHAMETELSNRSRNNGIPTWEPNPHDKTGTHSLVEIQKAHEELEAQVEQEQKERRDDSIWWKRKRWELTFAAAGALMLLLLSACSGVAGSYVLYKLETSSGRAPAHKAP